MHGIYKKAAGTAAGILFCIIIFYGNIHARAVQNIHLNQRSVVITAGKSKVLSLQGINNIRKKEVLWKSQDNKVISVNNNGKLKKKKEGYTIVTASYKGKEYHCKAIVVSKDIVIQPEKRNK